MEWYSKYFQRVSEYKESEPTSRPSFVCHSTKKKHFIFWEYGSPVGLSRQSVVSFSPKKYSNALTLEQSGWTHLLPQSTIAWIVVADASELSSFPSFTPSAVFFLLLFFSSTVQLVALYHLNVLTHRVYKPFWQQQAARPAKTGFCLLLPSLY